MSTSDSRLNLDPDAGLDERYYSEEAEPDWYKTNIPVPGGLPSAYRRRQLYWADLAGALRRSVRAEPPVQRRTRRAGPHLRATLRAGMPPQQDRRQSGLDLLAEARGTRPPAVPSVARTPQMTKDKKVAVIGAGSAGIAAARELAEMGYPVTIFDMYAAPGGMMVGGIPVWRLPREVTREECDEYLDALGVEVHLNTTIGKDLQLTDLLRDYDATYIGAGCMLSNPLTDPNNKDVPGADLEGVVPGCRSWRRSISASRSMWASASRYSVAVSRRWTAAARRSALVRRRSTSSIAAQKKRCLPTSTRSRRRWSSTSSSSTSHRQLRCSARTACTPLASSSSAIASATPMPVDAAVPSPCQAPSLPSTSIPSSRPLVSTPTRRGFQRRSSTLRSIATAFHW